MMRRRRGQIMIVAVVAAASAVSTGEAGVRVRPHQRHQSGRLKARKPSIHDRASSRHVLITIIVGVVLVGARAANRRLCYHNAGAARALLATAPTRLLLLKWLGRGCSWAGAGQQVAVLVAAAGGTKAARAAQLEPTQVLAEHDGKHEQQQQQGEEREVDDI